MSLFFSLETTLGTELRTGCNKYNKCSDGKWNLFWKLGLYVLVAGRAQARVHSQILMLWGNPSVNGVNAIGRYSTACRHISTSN